MDDLKQSVQNARFEQKDPLLIYKFESFELFKTMLSKLNAETTSFLSHAEVPLEDSSEINAAQSQKRRQLNENKAEAGSVANAGQAAAQGQDTREQTVQTPVTSAKVHGRNDRVTVQYVDGTMKKDVKFKSVENDVNDNKCVVVED